MNAYVFTDQTHTYTRISKAKARKLWGTVDIALCPANLRPGYPWCPHTAVTAESIQEAQKGTYDFQRERVDFDRIVQNFAWYNCTCTETGKYTAFYLIEER